MRSILAQLLILAMLSFVISCGGKNKSAEPEAAAKDTTVIAQPGNNDSAADSTLAQVKTFIESGLSKWAQSFKGFHLDSFKMTKKSDFSKTDGEQPEDLQKFYQLYQASLSYSPDSNYYVDLFSSGIWLEKKGKKIIATGDVDQSITLCNLKTKKWEQIAFFGPSAGIEEAIWTSASTFILAGTMHNDDGEREAFLLLGDVNNRSLRWFEAKIIRPASVNYDASGILKLKIDEWE